MTDALLGFGAIFVLALLRVPLAFAMGFVGYVGLGLVRGWPAAAASTAQVVYDSGFAYTLSVVPLFEKMIVESGIILIKYWLEVSAEEQQRRLEERIRDGRKIWKLSPMDLKSFGRWDDYTRARDEMFAASDSSWAPWYMARSEDKRRVRLNIISHLLEQVPYEDITQEQKIELPKRGKIGRYKSPPYPFRMVDERF